MTETIGSLRLKYLIQPFFSSEVGTAPGLEEGESYVMPKAIDRKIGKPSYFATEEKILDKCCGQNPYVFKCHASLFY